MKRLAALATACCALAAASSASAAERVLDRATIRQLASLPASRHLRVDAFPVGPTRLLPIAFERVSIFAGNAPVYVETSSGRARVPPSDHIFLRGYSADGAARVALALDPNLTVAHGDGIGPEGAFGLDVVAVAGGSRLIAHELDTRLPNGPTFDMRCANDNERIAVSRQAARLSEQLRSAVAAAQTTTAVHALRLAVVAVDTDSAFMSRLFSNDATSAANWIAGMFNTMNLMYERDLLVELQVGTTILRTNPGTDPYAGFTAGATTAQLDTFASNWKTNEAAVPRAFAVLLSGAIASTTNSCSASGIAWIAEYCQKGVASGSDTVGSYSVNQVCTSINVDPHGAFDAHLVGHELGHNFGAFHTHCTNAATGAAPTGTNTIDQCHSGESYVIGQTVVDCYSGPTSCPAAGTGTIMSYCNFSDSGCPANTQTLLLFNGVQVSQTLLPDIAAAPLGCLNTTDDVFFSGFE